MAYIFKKGDVVRYKKSEAYAMPSNLHGAPDHTKEFVVASNNYAPNGPVQPHWSLVMFEGDKGRAGVLANRIILVREASKEKKPNPEGNFAWGVFFEDGEFLRAFRTRQAARDWRDTQKFPIKKIKYEIV